MLPGLVGSSQSISKSRSPPSHRENSKESSESQGLSLDPRAALDSYIESHLSTLMDRAHDSVTPHDRPHSPAEDDDNPDRRRSMTNSLMRRTSSSGGPHPAYAHTILPESFHELLEVEARRVSQSEEHSESGTGHDHLAKLPEEISESELSVEEMLRESLRDAASKLLAVD